MSPDGLRQIFQFCLIVRDLCKQGNHSIHFWPDVTLQIAFSSKRKVPNRNKTNSSIKPNKFHSNYVCFAGRKARKERKICLKIRLFGFPQRLVMGSTTTAARKVVSSSTLIGPFEISAHAPIQQPLALALKFKPVLWEKLVGSRQRSLSSRFSLSRRERPLLAGKFTVNLIEIITGV